MLNVTPFCKNSKFYIFAKEKSRKCVLKHQYIFLGNGISGDFSVFNLLLMICFFSKISHLPLKTYLDE